ncbi:AmmeMemoRadiSam system protein B [Petrocella sp. FN5]|uniref:AmmeMemoRadiSam system protein B n=1 Tax=Petrocella sp. FN5 TaxID=3032002 RepID=UPI0023DC729C|nr:AmmeMemoRadiSam system protein B [Petrocella sp. FN5]MDF1618338.1 AmmeMemoRadiSam system protein B [Petrocella sp. FN5]
MFFLIGLLASCTPDVNKEEEIVNYDIDARVFIDKKQIGKYDTEYLEPIYGGLVPHHNVAHSMISDFYKTLKKDVELIILIGPNHGGKGPRYQVVGSSYMTHYGLVIPSPLYGELLNHRDVMKADDVMLRGEHSVGIHMNYIRANYEDTPVLTLLVHETGGIHGVDSLGKHIRDFIGDRNVVVIGSVDFSHDLSLELAKQKDQITKEIIRNKSYKRLFTLNNDYIDSPTTAYLTIMLLKELGFDHQLLLNEGNAALILNRPNMEATTSYFVYGYGKSTSIQSD